VRLADDAALDSRASERPADMPHEQLSYSFAVRRRSPHRGSVIGSRACSFSLVTSEK
jgi:hypothetical protein